MNNLKKILSDAKISHLEVANALNIKSLSTISLKINGKADFTTKEASILKNLINSKTNQNYTIEDLFESKEQET